MRVAFVLLLAFVLCFLQGSSADGECPGNQVYNNCGSACPPTCGNQGPENCIALCVPGCFCPRGLVKNGAGECVPSSQC